MRSAEYNVDVDVGSFMGDDGWVGECTNNDVSFVELIGRVLCWASSWESMLDGSHPPHRLKVEHK